MPACFCVCVCHPISLKESVPYAEGKTDQRCSPRDVNHERMVNFVVTCKGMSPREFLCQLVPEYKNHWNHDDNECVTFNCFT
jgi:hypothetical protein